MIFCKKIFEIYKSMLLAKALKIAILQRKNAYFQEIEDMKKERNNKSALQKNIFLGPSILNRFWEGIWEGL